MIEAEHVWSVFPGMQGRAQRRRR